MSIARARGGARGAAQLQVGVGFEDGAEVAGRVDLGDDGDVPGRGEVDDVADLRLGQVGVGDDLGVGLALDAERLVVGEVELELVELEVAHLADPGLDPVGAEVLARDVQGEAALRAVGGVGDGALGEPALGPPGLEEGAGAVEDPGVAASGDRDLAVLADQPVALGAAVHLAAGGLPAVLAALELDVAGAGRRLGDRHLQLVGEQLRLVAERVGGGDDPGAVRALPAPGPRTACHWRTEGTAEGAGPSRSGPLGGCAEPLPEAEGESPPPSPSPPQAVRPSRLTARVSASGAPERRSAPMAVRPDFFDQFRPIRIRYFPFPTLPRQLCVPTRSLTGEKKHDSYGRSCLVATTVTHPGPHPDPSDLRSA